MFGVCICGVNYPCTEGNICRFYELREMEVGVCSVSQSLVVVSMVVGMGTLCLWYRSIPFVG